MALGTINMFGSTEDEVRKKQKQYAKTVPKRVAEGVNAFKQRQQGFEGNKEGNAGANLGGTAYTADQEFKDRSIEDRSTRVGPINVIKNTQEEKDRIAAGAAKYDARIAAEKAMLKDARSKPRQISEYEKELAARNRRMMYNQILGNAGTKGKAISMNNALKIISGMEENRIQEEANAMNFQQAQTKDQTALERQRITERAANQRALMQSQTAQLDRASRERIASGKLGLDTEKLDLLEQEFLENSRKQAVAEEAAASTAAFEQEMELGKMITERMKAVPGLGKLFIEEGGTLDPTEGIGKDIYNLFKERYTKE